MKRMRDSPCLNSQTWNHYGKPLRWWLWWSPFASMLLKWDKKESLMATLKSKMAQIKYVAIISRPWVSNIWASMQFFLSFHVLSEWVSYFLVNWLSTTRQILLLVTTFHQWPFCGEPGSHLPFAQHLWSFNQGHSTSSYVPSLMILAIADRYVLGAIASHQLYVKMTDLFLSCLCLRKMWFPIISKTVSRVTSFFQTSLVLSLHQIHAEE